MILRNAIIILGDETVVETTPSDDVTGNIILTRDKVDPKALASLLGLTADGVTDNAAVLGREA